MKRTISITKALAEIKLTEKKLGDALSEMHFGFIAEGMKHVDIKESDIKKKDNAAVQRYNDLSAKLSALKTAVAKVNTEVLVKKGKASVTIYSQIEEKARLKRTINLLKVIRQDLKQKIDYVDKYNLKVESAAADLAGKIYGTNKKAADGETSELMGEYFKANQAKIYSAHSLEEIDTLINKCEEDLNNIDIFLSEANAKTTITVED